MLLYHYCNFNKFQSIIESKTLWLTQIIKSNDAEEVVRTFRIIWDRIKGDIANGISDISEMKTNKVMLHALLNKASVELINGKIILKEEYYSQYRQLIKSITSNASRMEMLKGALLINFNLEDELNEC